LPSDLWAVNHGGKGHNASKPPPDCSSGRRPWPFQPGLYYSVKVDKFVYRRLIFRT
jgi:hypothetical protein